jgi:hypothetical protein
MQKVTAKIDKVTGTVTQQALIYSGMAGITAGMKASAGIAQMLELRDLVKGYAKASRVDKVRLAQLGIGEGEAKRLGKFFERHGQDVDGIFEPNAHLWGGAGEQGALAARDLRVAIQRSMNRAVVTPGYGDIPLFMDGTLGRLLMQFQSYSFGFVNRVMVPMAQRAALYRDPMVLVAMTNMLALGTFVTAVREYMNGKNLADYDGAAITRKVIDRSGLLFWMSPYVDAAEKLTGVHIGGQSSKYTQNRWWESLMGPWAGTLTAYGELAGAAGHLDSEKVLEKAGRVAPFAQWWKLGNAVLAE